MNAPEKFFLPDIQSVSAARGRAYALESENFESIHNHSAYALVERDKDREQAGARGRAQALATPGSGLAPAT
jgi:hypothetical protein